MPPSNEILLGDVPDAAQYPGILKIIVVGIEPDGHHIVPIVIIGSIVGALVGPCLNLHYHWLPRLYVRLQV